MALRSDGTVPGTDHDLIFSRLGRDAGEILRDGLSRDGQDVAVQHAVREQDLHHLRNAAGAMQIGRDVVAGRLHVAETGNTAANGLEIVERERNFGGMGDGQQVQHRVGRAADRHRPRRWRFRTPCGS